MARPLKPMNARKQAWAAQINANKHEVYLFTREEFECVIASRPQHQQIRLKALWNDHRTALSNVAGYGSTAIDSVALKKLVWDLGGFPQGFKIKAYEQIVKGERYIIIKGFAGLRKILTGTRYLANNPKVVSMGLGELGANASIKSGGVFTVIALAAFRILDYFLTDKQTLSHLIGSLATDVVKVGITMAASWAGAVVMASVGLAIGPLTAIVVVGGVVGYFLGQWDSDYQITQKLVDAIDVQFARMEAGANNWRRFFENLPEEAEQAALQVLDITMETAKKAGLRWLEHHVNKIIPSMPRMM